MDCTLFLLLSIKGFCRICLFLAIKFKQSQILVFWNGWGPFDLDWSLTIEFFIAISEKYACLNVTDSLQAKLSRSDRIFGNILISKAEGGEN